MDNPKSPRVGIVDYGMGNLVSVRNAFQFLGAETAIIRSFVDFSNVDAIVLPGVGAFGQAMENLRHLDLVGPLTDEVMNKKIPFLGICLGMQMLANSSTELGNHPGLGWINGEVEHIKIAPGVRVPHVSWNFLAVQQKSKLLNNSQAQDHFYFDHSYQFTLMSENIVAYTNYHGAIPAIIERDHIFGTQFHPEKSQRAGLMLLRNFLNLITTGQVGSV